MGMSIARISVAFLPAWAKTAPVNSTEERPILTITGDVALTSSRPENGAVTAEIARKQADRPWLWAADQPSITNTRLMI